MNRFFAALLSLTITTVANAQTASEREYRSGIGTDHTFSLPVHPAWKMHSCAKRHSCFIYQQGRYLIGKPKAKSAARTYPPVLRINMNDTGSMAQALLDGVPMSMCRWGGKLCEATIWRGNSKIRLQISKVRGLGEEFEDIRALVTFIGDAENFSVTYIDERRRKVEILFPAPAS